ncbi:glutathione S-transferase family protein [Azorhizobium doebereinerae]|uniref:glutathione S-transferase family protein n=1 Tax=Azorhizobium doebereinerae TaxID=281091 RepID=UPI0004151D83|nr:glutathione S-transferase family protein [Azorhizobium doebereinerae]
MSLKLIVGNKTYSSWSLRPWLALSAAGIAFEEEVVPLDTDAFRARLGALGAAGRVPVLVDGDALVWESLAIIDWAAERHPGLWPSDPRARALARSIATEMHAGFSAVRSELPMNLARPAEPRALSPKGEADVARILGIWGQARARFGAGGPFLFGGFSAADAMFAPVAARFHTYQVPLDAVGAAYVAAIHAEPNFVRWRTAALAEPWVVAEDEIDWPLVKR